MKRVEYCVFCVYILCVSLMIIEVEVTIIVKSVGLSKVVEPLAGIPYNAPSFAGVKPQGRLARLT